MDERDKTTAAPSAGAVLPEGGVVREPRCVRSRGEFSLLDECNMDGVFTKDRGKLCVFVLYPIDIDLKNI